MILHLKILNNMEVIVKSSPKIEIELATKVVKVGGKVTVDSALSNESENPVQNKVITVALNEKVDKVSGKGLSTNDYTTSDKDKLASLENYDDSEIRTSLEEVETQIESQDALIKDLQDGKANKEGNYPSLRVGTADTADDLAGRGESVPAEFGFRASGGKSIKDGRAYIKSIKGNSVVWNQVYKPREAVIGTRTDKGVTFTVTADGSVTAQGTSETATNASSYIQLTANQPFLSSHIYMLVAFGAPAGRWSYMGLYFGGINNINSLSMIGSQGYKIFSPQADGVASLTLSCWGGQTIDCSFKPQFYDLTKMFGAGNEPSTIEEFYARVATLGVDMNAYNEGQVIHCNTESIKSVGDNAWDEEWEMGTYDSANGKKIDSDATIRSKNLIKVLPNTEYYISIPQDLYGTYPVRQRFYREDGSYIGSAGQNTVGGIFNTPADCAYVGLIIYSTTYNHDMCIRLAHTGYKTDYEPYWQDILPLPIIRNYFRQGMKSAGTAHDEIRYNKASGKWEMVQRIGSVDLGTFTYRQSDTSGGGVRFRTTIEMKRVKSASIVGNILCSQYDTVAAADTYRNTRGIAVEKTDGISIFNADYTDAAALKASLQGVILYYELADPIVTELDAEDQNFRDYYNVADFGTEMSQSSVPSAPFSADIIYQFNAVDMIREHEIEITELQSVIATMQAQLTSLINGGQ